MKPVNTYSSSFRSAALLGRCFQYWTAYFDFCSRYDKSLSSGILTDTSTFVFSILIYFPDWNFGAFPLLWKGLNLNRSDRSAQSHFSHRSSNLNPNLRVPDFIKDESSSPNNFVALDSHRSGLVLNPPVNDSMFVSDLVTPKLSNYHFEFFKY